jgi:DNA-binding response OmpR family regulator
MGKNRILLVEDEAPIRAYISKAIIAAGYDVKIATNGKEGYDFYNENPFPLVVTDLNMPIMLGEELIEKLNALSGPLPTIIVLTSQDDVKKVVEVMKKGVYDYVIKPANTTDLQIKIKNALKFHELNTMQYTLEKEKELRIQEQLTWIKYKEDLKAKDTTDFKNNIISNMKHNLGQTGGLGNLITLIDFIYHSATEEENGYRIDKEIMALLKENALSIQKTLDTIEDINYISENPIETKKVTISEIYNQISKYINDLKSFIELNSNSVVLSDMKSNFSILKVNYYEPYFERMIKEAILNACKYSVKNSKIFILFKTYDDKFVISILNEPSALVGVLGIPLEYSNIVFEPFYRISKFVDDRFQTLDLGFGLTMIKSIMKKFNGFVSIGNIKDFTASNSQNIKVNLELEIPLTIG